MRYQSLLFSSLLISVITFPLVAKADTNADIIRKNNADVVGEAYRRSLEIDTKLIIAQYKAMDESSSIQSGQKIHNKIMKIKINGRVATVRVRTTAIAKYSTSVAIGEDIWQSNNNGWKLVNSRVLSSNTTVNRPQSNPTGQVQTSTRHNSMEAFNLANEAMVECYRRKDSVACDRLDSIKEKLSQWCGQGDVEACSTSGTVANMEGSEKMFHSR
jgi:hypothetical protein